MLMDMFAEIASEFNLMLDIIVAISLLFKFTGSLLNDVLVELVLMLSALVEILAELVLMLYI